MPALAYRPSDGRIGHLLRLARTGGITPPARLAICVLILLAAGAPAWGDDDANDPRADRPGLVATWTDGSRTVSRLEPRLAFHLSNGQSPHPQLASKPFSGTWRGRLFVQRPGTYRFSAKVRGEFQLRLDGQTVVTGKSGGVDRLSAAQPSDARTAKPQAAPDGVRTMVGDAVELPYGTLLLEASFSKSAAGPAHLRLFWQRDGAQREPVPAWSLMHTASDETEKLAQGRQVEAGRRLVESLRCLRCHVSGTTTDMPPVAPATTPAPNLDGIGGRVTRNWLYHWLKRPRDFRPHATMPSLFGDSPVEDVDLYAVTEYLAAEGGPSSELPPAPDPERAGRGARAFATLGCVACHRALGEKVEGTSDLGSVEGLASKTNAAGIRRAITEPWAHWPASPMPDFQLEAQAPELLEDLVHYLARGRLASFESSPAAPAPEDLARRFEQLTSDPETRAAFEAADLPDRWRLLGNKVVAHRGCLECHPFEEHGRQRRHVNLPHFDALVGKVRESESPDGCLTPEPGAGVPDFQLTTDQRAAIAVFLAEGTTGPNTDAPIYETERRLDALGCTACHARWRRGGRFAERITQFVSLESDTTVRDVAPPELSGVGEKLRPQWLREVIEHGRRSRPWMQLKMPLFQEDAVRGLAEGLIAADGLSSPPEQSRIVNLSVSEGRTSPKNPTASTSPRSRFGLSVNGLSATLEEPAANDAAPEVLEGGRLLVGTTGFGCVSCHDFAGIESTGVRGPDLAGVVERVRRSWFTRWMFDPQAISPGTRMPSVFFDGKSAAPHLLDGEPERQLEALWAYLSLTRQLPLPEFGPSPGELVEGGESPTVVPRELPLLVHGYLGDHGGLRGIALGFPEGTHFGFDSERCRLVSVWQGGFLERRGWFDAGRGGAEKDGDRVLGNVIWHDPGDGCFAIEDDSAPASGTTVLGPPSSVRYEACWARTDDAGFAYRLEFGPKEVLSVEDRPAPLKGADFPAFRRHLTLTGPAVARAVWVRVGVVGTDMSSGQFYDREGRPIESKAPPGIDGLSKLGSRSSDVRQTFWASCEVGTHRWLISARGAPAGTRWVVRETSAGADARADAQDAVELWLRLPVADAEKPGTCELTYLRIAHDEAIDFEQIEAVNRTPEARE